MNQSDTARSLATNVICIPRLSDTVPEFHSVGHFGLEKSARHVTDGFPRHFLHVGVLCRQDFETATPAR